MKVVAGLLAAVCILILGGLALAPRRDILVTTDIAAPPARVWAVLTDTGAYPAWNKGMVLKGALTPGNTIEHDEGEGADRMVFHPVIAEAVPGRVLSWRGRLGVPGILDVLHYFTLVPIQLGVDAGASVGVGAAPAIGTRFAQGERLHGVLLWAWDWRQLVPRFQAMNAALKARAEQTAPGSVPGP